MLNPKKYTIEQWGPIDDKLLYDSIWLYPMMILTNKEWGIQWPEMIGVLDHDKITYFWEKEKTDTNGAKAIEKWIAPRHSRKKLYLKFNERIKLLKKLELKIEKINKSYLPDKIRFLAIDFLKSYQNMWSVALVPELANYGATKYLSEKIKKFVPNDKIQEALEKLLAPTQMSFHQKNDYELYKIILFAKSIKEQNYLLEKHAQEWYWIENSYYENKILTKDYFSNQIKEVTKIQAKKKLTAIENYFKNLKRQKIEIVKRYSILKETLDLANALSFSIWWQDKRKSLVWQAQYYIDLLFNPIEKIFKIEPETIKNYTIDELIELFKSGKKVNSKIIHTRKNYSVRHLKNIYKLGYKIFYGKMAHQMAAIVSSKEKINITKEIKGIPVSRGKVTGRVCLLDSPRNIYKMKRGDVLVAPMTSPDFIMAMKMAKAIVTDVGGLMSHAAVVSRELGIPCIVGTKIATQVLKDGDLVEVDANKGVVKKI